MKSLFFLLLLCCGNFVIAQNFKITWGDEIKLKKGTSDLDIVAADNTGLYFSESRLQMTSYLIIGATYGETYKLYKVDKNFSEVFEKEYRKELKGLDFNSFQSLGGDLFMFATDYEKKGKLFKVYGAKIDKNSGDLIGDFAELGSYALESKKDDYEMRVTPVHNGSAFLMVSNISAGNRVSLGISLLDKNLKKKEGAVINLSFDPGQYNLVDVRYTNSDKIVLLGRVNEEIEVGKKKKKRMSFKEFSLAIYDNRGAKEKDVSLVSAGRYVISGKLIEQPTGELLMAGFYSNSSSKDAMSGFFINKVDPEKGELVLSSVKEINSGMLGQNFSDDADDDDETRASKKQAQKAAEAGDEDDFPNAYSINSVDINPADNSILITSEVSKYNYYTYSSSTYDNATRTWRTTTTFVHRFTNQDILIIYADKDGKINWVNDLPKTQIEEIRTSSSGPGLSAGFYATDYGSYFAQAGGMPYYSSYTSMVSGNNLLLIFNDHTSNNMNTEYGNKVKAVYNFKRKSNVYGVGIDLSSGKMTRKFIASNNDETILMPRHALVSGNEFFVPSWRMHMLAKTQLKFAKISVK